MSWWAKCEECGRFIGFKNYVRYSYYGTYWDIDEPPPEFMCLKCWDIQTPEEITSLAKVCWHKPWIVRNGRGGRS